MRHLLLFAVVVGAMAPGGAVKAQQQPQQTQQPDKAHVALLRTLADSGKAEAQYALAEMYWTAPQRLLSGTVSHDNELHEVRDEPRVVAT
jgi:hypothetical protein